MSVLAYVLSSDDRLLGRVVGWRPPRWVRVWMLTASRLGDGWLWLATAALVAAIGPDGLRVLGALAASVATANALQVCVKARVRRPRPRETVRAAGFDVGLLAWLWPGRCSAC